MISTWFDLGIFLAYDNQFTGNLYHVFNSSHQFELSQIDVSSNQLTGTLPANFFESPVLSIFAAMDNCIHGSLPKDICNSKILAVVILDGMMSGANCQKKFFPSLNTYALSSSVKGTVPPCLFSMTHLQTLHLSGNGFTGTLPSDLNVSVHVSDLSLSHNVLSGAIPLSIQNRAWSNLDLSYNKFNGELSDSFYPPTGNDTISLEVNRLSNGVPASLQTAYHLNILDGNLFSCTLERSNLPDHDPNYSTYQCGSNSLNYSLYLFVALLFTVCILIGLGVWFARRLASNDDFVTLQLMVESWYEIFIVKENKLNTATSNVGFQVMQYHLDTIRKSGAYIVIAIVLFLLPAYISLSQYYSMYSVSYAWEVSAIYLSGVGASATLLCFWAVWAAAICFLMYCLLPASLTSTEHSSSETTSMLSRLKSAQFYKGLLYSSCLLLVNGAAVTAVNVGYVYVNHTSKSSVIFVVQIAVVFFKLTWNGTAVKKLVRIITATEASEGSEEVFKARVRLLSIITLFNNLVAPFVATAFISSDCFNNIFVPASTVTSTFTDEDCPFSSGGGKYSPFYECDLESVLVNTSSFVPPFMYSYQCASTFVSTYANVFVYMFIVVGFVRPAYQVILKVVLRRYAEKRQSFLLDLLNKTLPNLLSNKYDGYQSAGDSTRLNHKKVATPFQVDAFTAELLNCFGILFSFGVVFPPLGVVIVVALILYSYFTQLLMVVLCLCKENTRAMVIKKTWLQFRKTSLMLAL